MIALISLAYLEEDRLLLAIALAGRRSRADGHVGRGLGDGPRRGMDQPLLVAWSGSAF